MLLGVWPAERAILVKHLSDFSPHFALSGPDRPLGKIYVNCGFMRTERRVKDKTNWIVSVWGLLRIAEREIRARVKRGKASSAIGGISPTDYPLLFPFLLSSFFFLHILYPLLSSCLQKNNRILDSLKAVAVKHTPIINYSLSEKLHDSYM